MIQVNCDVKLYLETVKLQYNPTCKFTYEVLQITTNIVKSQKKTPNLQFKQQTLTNVNQL